MRKMLGLMIAAVMATACSKSEVGKDVEPLQESVVYLNLSAGNYTKATGTGHGVQSDDSNIETLEVFIFRINEGNPDDGVLDGYRKFTADQLGDLSKLEIQTTTGRKMIYAVANAHRANWEGVNTRAVFEQQTALLTLDNVKNFIMTGGTEAQLQLASTVAFPIKRLVARIQVNSIKTEFAGGPYAGAELKDVKAYITNVQGEKIICNGSGNNLKVLNLNGYMASDAAACTMPGMLYEDLGVNISDAGYTKAHYFYCYENNIAEESGNNKFTRLIIEGTLNGIKYYYPIAIEGIERNCCYAVDITIKRPGSLKPDSDVEKGTLLANVNVLNWKFATDSVVEF